MNTQAHTPAQKSMLAALKLTTALLLLVLVGFCRFAPYLPWLPPAFLLLFVALLSVTLFGTLRPLVAMHCDKGYSRAQRALAALGIAVVVACACLLAATLWRYEHPNLTAMREQIPAAKAYFEQHKDELEQQLQPYRNGEQAVLYRQTGEGWDYLSASLYFVKSKTLVTFRNFTSRQSLDDGWVLELSMTPPNS